MGSQTPPQPRVLMTGIAFGSFSRWSSSRSPQSLDLWRSNSYAG